MKQDFKSAKIKEKLGLDNAPFDVSVDVEDDLKDYKLEIDTIYISVDIKGVIKKED